MQSDTENSEGVVIMIDRLDGQDDRLQQHSERLHQLEKWDKELHNRMKLVEESDLKQAERLKEAEDNYMRLENTILSENKETRMFFQSNMDRLWDLTRTRDDHRHDSRKMKHEISKTKVERWSDIFFKLAGTGGIVYLIIQQVM